MEGWWRRTTARTTLPSLLASTREFWNGVGSCTPFFAPLDHVSVSHATFPCLKSSMNQRATR